MKRFARGIIYRDEQQQPQILRRPFYSYGALITRLTWAHDIKWILFIFASVCRTLGSGGGRRTEDEGGTYNQNNTGVRCKWLVRFVCHFYSLKWHNRERRLKYYITFSGLGPNACVHNPPIGEQWRRRYTTHTMQTEYYNSSLGWLINV